MLSRECRENFAIDSIRKQERDRERISRFEEGKILVPVKDVLIVRVLVKSGSSILLGVVFRKKELVFKLASFLKVLGWVLFSNTFFETQAYCIIVGHYMIKGGERSFGTARVCDVPTCCKSSQVRRSRASSTQLAAAMGDASVPSDIWKPTSPQHRVATPCRRLPSLDWPSSRCMGPTTTAQAGFGAISPQTWKVSLCLISDSFAQLHKLMKNFRWTATELQQSHLLFRCEHWFHQITSESRHVLIENIQKHWRRLIWRLLLKSCQNCHYSTFGCKMGASGPPWATSHKGAS